MMAADVGAAIAQPRSRTPANKEAERPVEIIRRIGLLAADTTIVPNGTENCVDPTVQVGGSMVSI
jgi:hypothetical protein